MLPSGTGTNTVIFAREQRRWLKCDKWLIIRRLLYMVVTVPLLGIETELPGWAIKSLLCFFRHRCSLIHSFIRHHSLLHYGNRMKWDRP